MKEETIVKHHWWTIFWHGVATLVAVVLSNVVTLAIESLIGLA